MTIRQQLLASFLLIIMLAGGLGFMAVRGVSEVGALVTRMYEGPLAGISFARSAQAHFADAMRHMMAAVRLSQNFGSAADRERIDSAFGSFMDDVAVVTERMPDPEIREHIAAVVALATAWKTQGDRLLGGGGATVTEIPTATVLEQQGERVYEAIGVVVEDAAVAGYMFSLNADELVSETIRIDMIIVGTVIVTSLLLALVISGRLVGRMRLAMATARRVADGDLDNEILAKGRDECSQLLMALADMQASLRARREADLRDAEAKEREKAKSERQRSELESRIAEFERRVAEVLGPVAEAIDGMRSTTSRMVELASDTDAKTGTVAAATRLASENVQTVAAAAEELSASISEIGERVVNAGRIAGEAVSEAEHTNRTVSSLSEAAQRIGDIVDLIQNIAEQTNLLALNATIEAARAGDAGRGFAVVASEVKSLATQTAKATEEISAQIAAIQSVTAEAATAISQIGTTIVNINEQTATIASAVEEQNAATAEIARNVQAAAAGTNEVSDTIGDVSAMATKSGRMAGALVDISSSVSERSHELRQSIESFLASIRAA